MDENEIFEGDDIVTLTDEEGVEKDYEIIGSVEVDEKLYYALVPCTDDGKEPEEYIVLRSELEKNEEGEEEEVLVSIEDDEEFDRVADIFDDEFADIDYDMDGEEGEE